MSTDMNSYRFISNKKLFFRGLYGNFLYFCILNFNLVFK